MDWFSSWSSMNEDEKRQTVEKLQWLSWNGPRMMRGQYMAMLDRITESLGIPRGIGSSEGFQAAATVQSLTTSITNKVKSISDIRKIYTAIAQDILTLFSTWSTSTINTTSGAVAIPSTLGLIDPLYSNPYPITLRITYQNSVYTSVSSFTISVKINNKDASPSSFNGSKIGLKPIIPATATTCNCAAAFPQIASYDRDLTYEPSYYSPNTSIGMCSYSKSGVNYNRSEKPASQHCTMGSNRQEPSGDFTISVSNQTNKVMKTLYIIEPAGTKSDGTTTVITSRTYIGQTDITNSFSNVYNRVTPTSSNIVSLERTLTVPNNINALEQDVSIAYLLIRIDILTSINTIYSVLPNYTINMGQSFNRTRILDGWDIESGTTQIIQLHTANYPKILSQTTHVLNILSKVAPFTSTSSLLTSVSTINQHLTTTSQDSFQSYSETNLATIATIASTPISNYSTYIQEGFKAIYAKIRSYVLDSELQLATVSTRTATYATAPVYTGDDLINALRDMISVLITKYGTTTNTTISPSDVVSTSTPVSTLVSLYTTYTGSTKWGNYITSTITSITDSYKTARVNASITAGSLFVSDATITTDKTVPTASVSTSGVVSFILGSTSYATMLEYVTAINTKYSRLINDIQLPINIKSTYELARRYVVDSTLLPNQTLITAKNNIYSGSSPSTNDMLSVYRSIISGTISTYNTTTGTQADSSDVSSATAEQLNALSVKYFGGGTTTTPSPAPSPSPSSADPLWVQYENTLRSKILSEIDSYKITKVGISTLSPFHYLDDELIHDKFYIESTRIVKVSLTPVGSFEFGVEYGPQKVFIPPREDSLYVKQASTVVTTPASYKFPLKPDSTQLVELTSTFDHPQASYTVKGKSYTIASDSVVFFLNPLYTTTDKALIYSIKQIKITLPTNATTIRFISYGYGLLQTSTPTVSLAGLGSTTMPATTTLPPYTNTFFVAIGTYAPRKDYSFTVSNTSTNINNIGALQLYESEGYNRRFTTALEYLNVILTKYKTAVDSIVGGIRAPATASITRFRDMYNKLTKCIQPGIDTNVTYAPTVAANKDATTDEAAIGQVLSKADANTYVAKYTAAIINAFNNLRTDEIEFLQSYKRLYDSYFNIQGRMPGFALLPTAEITDNGAARITELQAIPLMTAGTLPTDTQVDDLAGICNSYNGTDGLYAKLITHVKTNALSAVQAFETYYTTMPDFIKTAIGYQSILVNDQIPDARAPTVMADLKQNYDTLTGVVMLSAYTIYMAYRQYLTSADITDDMTTYIAKCAIYEPQTTFTLQAGDAYGVLIQGGISFTNAFNAKLVSRYNALFTYMTGRNIALGTITLPTSIGVDGGKTGAAAWTNIDAYVRHFELLVGKLQTVVVERVNAAAKAAAVSNAVKQIASAVSQGDSSAMDAAKSSLRTAMEPIADSSPLSGSSQLQQIRTKVISESKNIASVPTGLYGSTVARSSVATVVGNAFAKMVPPSPAAGVGTGPSPSPSPSPGTSSIVP